MTLHKRNLVGEASWSVCTGHPDCEGERLMDNHDAECPFDSGEDCDNDTCWRGCKHCVMQGELN
jgi:hypothetical protein